jgi:glycolate oxidase iron-sulfur subunit
MMIERVAAQTFGPQALEKMKQDLLSCMRCGFCLPACPIYDQARTETNSPRGWLALTKAVVEDRHSPTRNFAHLISNCLSCKACTAVCPPGVPIDDLILAARALTASTRRALWLKAALLRLAMGHPARMDRVLAPLRLYQRSGLQSVFRSLRVGSLLPSLFRELDQFVPRFARRSGRKTIPGLTPAKGERKYRVGYFLSCMDAAVFPESAAATVAVLSENGCEVVTPPAVACCGMPSRAVGDLRTLRECIAWNTRLFEDVAVDAVIADCATCGSMLKDYGHLVVDDPARERAEKFSAQVIDVSAFLAAIGWRQPRSLRQPLRITYHDPCHLNRAQGVREQPRRILQSVGAELVEMEDADLCCGGAGSYSVTHLDLSLPILERKTGNILATGAPLVATGCPSCQMQLQAGVRRAGMLVGVIHPIVLLAQAYAAENADS